MVAKRQLIRSVTSLFAPNVVSCDVRKFSTALTAAWNAAELALLVTVEFEEIVEDQRHNILLQLPYERYLDDRFQHHTEQRNSLVAKVFCADGRSHKRRAEGHTDKISRWHALDATDMCQNPRT